LVELDFKDINVEEACERKKLKRFNLFKERNNTYLD